MLASLQLHPQNQGVLKFNKQSQNIFNHHAWWSCSFFEFPSLKAIIFSNQTGVSSYFYPFNVVAKALSRRHPCAFNLFFFLYLKTEAQPCLVLLSHCITFSPPDQHEATFHSLLPTLTVFIYAYLNWLSLFLLFSAPTVSLSSHLHPSSAPPLLISPPGPEQE